MRELKRLTCMAVVSLTAVVSSQRAFAASYFIAVSGVDDGAQGQSLAMPWHTFAFALPKLQPGDTLWLADGTYTPQTTGLINVNCGVTGTSGTINGPVMIRSVNERQAVLKSDGTVPPIVLYSCSYWVLDGLTATMADLSAAAGSTGDSTVSVYGGDHVTLHRLLVQGTNRYFNTAGISYQAGQLLAEECEVYDFHRVGIAGSGATIRRCYMNSRGYADIVGGETSYDPVRGDAALEVVGGAQVFENNISEGQSLGFAQHSYGTSPSNDHDLFAGNISLSDQSGAAIFAELGQPPPAFTRFQDQLVYGCVAGAGFEAISAPNGECSHCTVLNGAQGFVMGRMPNAYDGGASTYLDSCFAGFMQGDAYAMEGQDDWLWSSCAGFDAGMLIDPLGLPAANMPDFEVVDPKVGSCIVYLPAGSPLKHAAADGGDIGASVIFRYVDGGLTREPLWNPVTGAFPCGAVYSGINDVAGASCRDVHLRLNVGVNGCPIPPEYFEDAGTMMFDGGSDAGSQSSDGGGEAVDGGVQPGDAGVGRDGGSVLPDGGVAPPNVLATGCGCGATESSTIGFACLVFCLSRRKVSP